MHFTSFCSAYNKNFLHPLQISLQVYRRSSAWLDSFIISGSILQDYKIDATRRSDACSYVMIDITHWLYLIYMKINFHIMFHIQNQNMLIHHVMYMWLGFLWNSKYIPVHHFLTLWYLSGQILHCLLQLELNYLALCCPAIDM